MQYDPPGIRTTWQASHIHSTKFPGQVGSRLTGQTQTVMPSRRSQTVEVVLAITGYAPNGSTSGTATATVAHRATIAQTGQPATVLSWLRHPTTIARTEAAAGANTRHPGRNAWAVCLRSPSVHQERTRAGSAGPCASTAQRVSPNRRPSRHHFSSRRPSRLPWHLRLQASQRRPSQRRPSALSPQASSCFRPSPRTQPSRCPSHCSSRSVSQPAVLPVC